MINPTENLTDYFLDITAEVCPFTFVKTKLMLERMQSGQTLAVHLQGHEPLNNVPRSVRDEGHTIVSLQPLENEDVSGVHRLIIQKS